MAVLSPFRALRPETAAAARVAAVPYDVVSAAEARTRAAGNPVSFLHVSRAEIDLPADTHPYADAVYRAAAQAFARIAREAPLVRDDTPRLYVYQLRMGGHVQTGVAGGFAVDEYDAGLIRKHEHTRRDKEDDRTRHILTLRAQTGPVFLTYRTSAAVDALVEQATAASAPVADFVADDGVVHTVWVLEPEVGERVAAAFLEVPVLYIADGHHRAASASRVRRLLREGGDPAVDAGMFLAVAFPHAQMQVLPYNRLVKDLAGQTPSSLVAALRTRVAGVREEGPAAPVRAGEVGMYLDGRWYTVELGPAPGQLAAADRLDVSRLQELVLAPLLQIGDPRSDPRIDFVGGIRGTAALEQAVSSGGAAVAFSMYPVRVEDLMAVADAGGIMPPKSTWFEPKLRDGLLTHLI